MHLNLSTQSISLTSKTSGARGFCGNRGTCGQKSLYREMNASSAVGLRLSGCPVDVSLTLSDPINSDCKKGNDFSLITRVW